jgi:8-oxo-dGTP pyrophosphatase MutT (NUDIX family)
MPRVSDRRPFTQLSRETVFTCPYYEIWHDRYVLPQGGTGDYYILGRADSVFVIPEVGLGRYWLTKQLRYILQRESVEFPGGGIDEGETPEQAAARELREELGLVAGELLPIARFAPYNGVTNEYCHLFVARHLTPVGRGSRDASEAIEPLEWDADRIEQSITDNTIFDGMTVAAWMYYQLAQRRI